VIGFAHSNESDSAADFAVECLEPSSSAEYIGRLGDIEIQEVIGHGGMGVVLKGYQSELKRLVAVKVLAPQLAVSAAARKRFAREAQATAAFPNPLRRRPTSRSLAGDRGLLKYSRRIRVRIHTSSAME
jgi:serine/threonine-protein kinase